MRLQRHDEAVSLLSHDPAGRMLARDQPLLPVVEVAVRLVARVSVYGDLARRIQPVHPVARDVAEDQVFFRRVPDGSLRELEPGAYRDDLLALVEQVEQPVVPDFEVKRAHADAPRTLKPCA